MPVIRITPPETTNFKDGYYTGAKGGGGITPPGAFVDYAPTNHFWEIPPITPLTSGAHSPIPAINKRIVYVNGIQTFSQSHANTVKLISVITGANVCGVYNMSGDGHEVLISKNTEVVLSVIDPKLGAAAKVANGVHFVSGFLNDLGQCITDKLMLVALNPATMTLARAIVDSCLNNVQLNIIAHSQGAIITSGAVRTAIAALALVYSANEQAAQPHNFLQFVKDMTILGQIEKLQRMQRIHRKIKALLRERVSIQTFGGAATWYPDGPWYRHVYNTAGTFSGDPVPKLSGQGNIFAYSGGGTVERLNRGGRGVSGNHSIDDNYLQNSAAYSGGSPVSNADYVPVHLDMLR